MKDAFGFLLSLVLIVAAIVGIGYVGYLSYAFYAPRYEQVRRNTFEQSQAYNDGMLRDLDNLQLQYEQAPDTQKMALRAVILHRFSVYPEERLPPRLAGFYNSLRNGG